MDNTSFESYKVEDRSYTSFIKREIHNKVSHGCFNPSQIAEIDIIISELTSNLIKHAGSGELLYRLSNDNGISVFEVICIDNGVGMGNVPQMMKDGISTKNTLGQGLGAIRRLSSLFQIYSLEKWGTVAYSKVISQPEQFYKPSKKGLEIRALNIPKTGEQVSGDGFHIKETETNTSIFFGDGLGHGQQAHHAVQQAIESFKNCSEKEPVEILKCIHHDIKKTRGVVGSIAVLDHQNMQWRICGIGNILVRLYSGIVFKNYMSYNGIMGLNIPNSMKNFEAPGENNQYLVMCSDGIRSRWDFARYTALFKYDLTIPAAILYKDFSRRNDDTSVLIGKLTV